jgi:hypothetical protein
MSGSEFSIHDQLKSWVGTLDALREANLGLQYRLAQEVKRAGGKERLETLEKFLDSFLIKDMHISLLRKDVKAQEMLVAKDTSNTDFHHRQLKLKRDVMRMSEEFARLKEEFEERFCVRGAA